MVEVPIWVWIYIVITFTVWLPVLDQPTNVSTKLREAFFSFAWPLLLVGLLIDARISITDDE